MISFVRLGVYLLYLFDSLLLGLWVVSLGSFVVFCFAFGIWFADCLVYLKFMFLCLIFRLIVVVIFGLFYSV